MMYKTHYFLTNNSQIMEQTTVRIAIYLYVFMHGNYTENSYIPLCFTAQESWQPVQ